MSAIETLPSVRRGTGPVDQALRARAAAVVPGGMWGHQATGPMHLPESFPQFFAGAQGLTVRDVDGHEYLDLMCSWGPMILGYSHPRVEAAAAAQRAQGDTLNGPGAVLVELAELLVDTVAHADWAVLAKNGTDATTSACTIARAATGRRKVLKATTSYHGANPPFTPVLTGTTPEDRAHVVEFTYNDVASLAAAADAHHGDVAAVIVTPFFHDGFGDAEEATPQFAAAVRALCDQIGAALVLDEVRTGFRLDLRGGWEPLGVRPDLTAFSKALANGYPISAVTGVDALRDAVTQVYLTGSFWTQAVPMAAAVATVRELITIDGPTLMRGLGDRLVEGLREGATAAGVPITVSGPSVMPRLRFHDDPELKRANTFCAAALDLGTYLHPWHNWFLSTAHTTETIDAVVAAADAGFAAVARL